MTRTYFVSDRNEKLLAKAIVQDENQQFNHVVIISVTDPTLESQQMQDISCKMNKSYPDEISIVKCIENNTTILEQQDIDISQLKIKNKNGTEKW